VTCDSFLYLAIWYAAVPRRNSVAVHPPRAKLLISQGSISNLTNPPCDYRPILRDDFQVPAMCDPARESPVEHTG
jgi:hypothetical protein